MQWSLCRWCCLQPPTFDLSFAHALSMFLLTPTHTPTHTHCTVSGLALEPTNDTLRELSDTAKKVLDKQAAEKAKSLDPQKVAETIPSGATFDTVLGPLSYDAKGDRKSVDFVWYVWKKGADGKITYKQL